MRHPTRSFVALLVSLMSAFSMTSCVTRPAMQVIVEIDAEEDLKAEITNVRVELFGTSDNPPEPDNLSFPSPHTWPFVAVLAPQNRDVTRRFRVQATASVGVRTIITRASSGFAPDRTWHLRLRFERACLDLPCEVESSCRSGRCERAEVPVGGEDAGVGEAGASDVGASDAGLDAGSDTRIEVAPDARFSDAGMPTAGPEHRGPLSLSPPARTSHAPRAIHRFGVGA